MQHLLQATVMLDYDDEAIQNLIKARRWETLNDVDKVKQIYNFVRDDIAFGYNQSDHLRASDILKDGYGQCNTKATLLMALLRAVNIPTRLHGFTIDKALQKGAITGIWYRLSPQNILHSWVEVYLNNHWYILEGVILDQKYFNQLRKIHHDVSATFCGFGVFTHDFNNPPIDWHLNNTYIQDLGINQDFGLFNSPDEFYQKHRQALSPIQRFLFKHVVRHQMNRNVKKIRENKTLK